MRAVHSDAPAPGLLSLIDGRDLGAGVGETLELVTLQEGDRLGIALLSVGEVLAVTAHRWRLAVRAGSGTAQALSRPGVRVLLTAVLAGEFHCHDVVVRQTWPLAVGRQRLIAAEVEVSDVRIDTVDYATLTSGIRYALVGDERDVIQRWSDTIAALRLPPPAKSEATT